MTKQYETMPDWAKKQAWNKGLRMKGMEVDPRGKGDVLDEVLIRKFLDLDVSKPKSKSSKKRKAA